ncbi:MAG: 7TM-DISM domain-containing protein, partial [Spirochaetota bacterium]
MKTHQFNKKSGFFMMVKRIGQQLLVFSVLILICTGCSRTDGKQNAPAAAKGVLDLSGWDFEKNGSVNIDGEWEFYWNRLLTPEDFAEKKITVEEYRQVPGYWNTYSRNGVFLPASGFATYRVRIILETRGGVIGMHVPEAISSSRLWVNGMPAAECGTVSEDLSNLRPQFIGRIIYVPVSGNTLDIVYQVANSSYRKSGIWRSLSVGNPRIISSAHDARMGIDMFLFGCLLIMALYHIGLYVYRKNDRSALYFGLFCLIIVVRILTTGEHVLETAFPSFSWEIARKLEFSPLFFGSIFFMMFLFSLFPKEISRKVLTGFFAVLAVMGTAVMIIPVRLGSYLVVPLQIIILLGIVYILGAMIAAVARKREGSWYILAGFVVIMITSINDMLYSNSIIHTAYLMPFGLFLFIFSQSLMLAMRFSQSFITVAALSGSLRETNRSLNRFVPHEFLEYLGRKSIVDVRLGDQILSGMTVMFIDIRN